MSGRPRQTDSDPLGDWEVKHGRTWLTAVWKHDSAVLTQMPIIAHGSTSQTGTHMNTPPLLILLTSLSHQPPLIPTVPLSVSLPSAAFILLLVNLSWEPDSVAVYQVGRVTAQTRRWDFPKERFQWHQALLSPLFITASVHLASAAGYGGQTAL